jgi:hypothetical protein
MNPQDNSDLLPELVETFLSEVNEIVEKTHEI